MATEAVLDKNEMNYSDVNGTNNGHNDSLDNRTAEDIWGFPLEDLYKLALAFYRGMYHINRLRHSLFVVPTLGDSTRIYL